MGFIAYLILGLIAGAIAKAILPGKQGGGLKAQHINGVIGAMKAGCL
ncbi:MAG: GlsB/YeaQ/YmgE family stress response membrane protein, partial [Brevibacterium aurantiacum]|nr:GlsB/YeaQ/YmgE family stress response membrane protein [Brevibacterium aurantiacum]